MNITNNISFQGKREVMHALNCAGLEARNLEIFRSLSKGARPLNKTLDEKACESSLNAYMHMAVFDDSFESTLGDFPKEKNYLKRLMKEEKGVSTIIKPFETFKASLLFQIRRQQKSINPKILEDFFAKIK